MEHKVLARYPLGNPHRKWKQSRFLLTVASPGPMSMEPKSEWTRRKTRRAVKTSMDVGFDVIGCLWADPVLAMDIVRAGEQYGASILFQDLQRFGGMGDRNVFCKTNDYEGAIRDTEFWNCVKGYIMWDEPILPEHLEETRRMVDYCERIHPEYLPYTVANPSYHPRCSWSTGEYAPYIERFLDVIDPAQMSFDYYPIGTSLWNPSDQLDKSLLWHDLEIVRRAAQAHEIPFWYWYQGQRFPWHSKYYTFHFNMARMLAFSGILHGVKALEAYTEFDGYVDPTTGGPGEYYEAQKHLNEELHNLGNVLMALNCLRVIHDDSLLPDVPEMEGLRTPMSESELLDGVLPPRISISEHKDAYGNRYLMVLNRDYEDGAFSSLKMKNRSHVYEVSKEDGEEHFLYEDTVAIPVHLAPGELRLYRIQPATEAPYTVEYVLEMPKENK